VGPAFDGDGGNWRCTGQRGRWSTDGRSHQLRDASVSAGCHRQLVGREQPRVLEDSSYLGGTLAERGERLQELVGLGPLARIFVQQAQDQRSEIEGDLVVSPEVGCLVDDPVHGRLGRPFPEGRVSCGGVHQDRAEGELIDTGSGDRAMKLFGRHPRW
jgi:hypothetical protein